MTVDVEELSQWVGKSQYKTGHVPAGTNRALRAVLNLGGAEETITHGIHWLLFNDFVPAAEIGPDGHPRRGGFLPPVKLPRRMWAGSRLEFYQPINEGDKLTRRSTISSVTPKEGRAGLLVFVTVDHEIFGLNGVAIKEQQDIVYMDIQPAAPRPNTLDFASESGSDGVVVPDEVMLFRYSALTSNSHRIHYDLPYAKDIELYPGLVVHGPLTATLVMAYVSQSVGNKPLRKFMFRGQRPLYVGDPIYLETSDNGSLIEACAKNPAGAIAMSCTAEVDR